MKYKIEKKLGVYTNNEWFYVYRRTWYFGWERIGNIEATLEGAKDLILQDKRERQKAELVGYYS